MRRRAALKAAALAGLLLAGGMATAHALRAVATVPVAEAVIVHGSNAQYVVRFDRPIDHYASRLEILRDGTVIERLRPLADSAAEALFAEAPRLPPGRYELRWVATTGPGGETSSGSVSFTVRP
jgi:methionine-rich copper-binding protein CopC